MSYYLGTFFWTVTAIFTKFPISFPHSSSKNSKFRRLDTSTSYQCTRPGNRIAVVRGHTLTRTWHRLLHIPQYKCYNPSWSPPSERSPPSTLLQSTGYVTSSPTFRPTPTCTHCPRYHVTGRTWYFGRVLHANLLIPSPFIAYFHLIATFAANNYSIYGIVTFRYYLHFPIDPRKTHNKCRTFLRGYSRSCETYGK